MLALASSGAAFAGDSPQEVQAALQHGNYSLAEQEMRQAISEHPQSAKAHYVLAQVLAHEGNIGDAAKEANQAQQLDPRLGFTDPARFERFQAELHQALAPVQAHGAVVQQITHPMLQVEHRHFHMLWLILGLLVIVGLFMVFRRNGRDAAGYDQRGYAPPQTGAPNGYGPAYPPQAPAYPQQPPAAGSGLGGAFVGGLAGGVLGAAAVEMFENHERRVEQGGFGGSQPFGGQPGNFTNNDPQGQAYEDLRSSPIDMGNDDSSWGGGSSFDTGDDDSWS
jgi:hypothetical protein